MPFFHISEKQNYILTKANLFTFPIRPLACDKELSSMNSGHIQNMLPQRKEQPFLTIATNLTPLLNKKQPRNLI